MAKVLLISAGSDGDVLPLLTIGKTLETHGHTIGLLAHDRYLDWGLRRGWVCKGLCSGAEYRSHLKDIGLLAAGRTMSFLGKYFLEWNIPGFEFGVSFRADVVFSQRSLKVACDRLVADFLKVPLVYILVEPPLTAKVTRSDFQVLYWRLVKDLQERLGATQSSACPRYQLGCWPEWFWPEASAGVDEVLGFIPSEPLFEISDHDREKFRGGNMVPCIAGTIGTTDGWAPTFFAASAQGTTLAGYPHLLLGGDATDISDDPELARRWLSYAPLNEVLPFARAIIHHGGIGTCMTTLAAGLPQITVPRVFKQKAISVRLHNLGVSRLLPAESYTAPAVASTLQELLHSERILERCLELAGGCAESFTQEKLVSFSRSVI